MKDKKFIFLSIFFSLWIIKNIISTGCLLYPIQKTCFESLKWTNIEQIKGTSLSSEVWTKDWSNFENKSKITKREFLENFNWFDSWLKNHFKVILEIILPYIISCIILIIFLTFKNNKNNKIFDKYYLYFF